MDWSQLKSVDTHKMLSYSTLNSPTNKPYSKKLRQQILQEAIEGKTHRTVAGRKPQCGARQRTLRTHTGRKKPQLIQDKKIKKQKTLPPN